MAIPPVTLNLLQLLPGDDQNIHTDKINYNFDQILSLGGGPPGLTGAIGAQGVPGSQGIQGFMGDPGTPGTKWYVQATIPALSPSPEIGDYWFNTDTLEVTTWDGSNWVPVGTLTIAGVFKDAIGDSDRVIFTNPTPLKSLVLSPLDYGVGAPAGGAYKLKLIGTSGSNVMNFGVVEGAAENTSSLQSYITVNTITPASEYGFAIVNPAGPIESNAPGTTLRLTPQAAGISNFEFNGLSLKMQINPTERNMGFSPVVGSNLGFHIGLQDALTTPLSRGLSVIDHTQGFKVSLRGAHSNPVLNDATIYNEGIFFDASNKQLGGTANSRQLWMRNRGLISGFNRAALNIETERTFNDAGNGVDPWRSVRMSIQAKIDASDWHGIHFEGGAFDATENDRAAMRFTIPSGGTRAGQDINGYWSFGSSAFHQLNNSTVNTNKQFRTNINIEGPAADTTQGLDVFGGLHFVPESPASGSSKRMGITAGLYHGVAGTEAVSSTHGGMLFKKVSNALQLEFSTGNAGVPISGTAGALTRQTIKGSGEIQFHGMKNATETVARDYKLKFLMDWQDDGVGDIFAFDSLAHGGAGMYKDIVLQAAQSTFTDADNANFRGGGFLGIGNMNDFINDKPQTKLHVFGAVTFGGRQTVTDYVTDVVANHWHNNWTFGFEHKTNAHNALILGGYGNEVTDPVSEVVVIGSVNGAGTTIDNVQSNNMVIIPSFSFQTTRNDFTTSGIQAPRPDGIYERLYSATAGLNYPYVFGVNSGNERAVSRISYANSTTTNRASNGLDIIFNTTVGGTKFALPGGPSFIPPDAKGYYLHCIRHELDISFGATLRDKTAFIVNGYNQVGIGGIPRYLPNWPSFVKNDPSTWPPAGSSGSSPGKWVPNRNASLQIWGDEGSFGGSIVLDHKVSSTNSTSTSASGVLGAIRFRDQRNDYTENDWATGVTWITTPHFTVSQDRIAGAAMVVSPGLHYADAITASNQRVHGSTLYLKGGEAGSNNGLTSGVQRGGDVVIHGGKAWYNANEAFTRSQSLNNNNDTDTGYGNVSLAYDWSAGVNAGSVSVGVGTPVQAMYCGRIQATKTGTSTGSVALLSGKDFRGQAMTISGGYNSHTVTATVTFPTPLPLGDVICVCNMDTTSGNHYPFRVYCTARSQTSINITVTTLGGTSIPGLNSVPWGSGSVFASFIVYSIPN